MRFVTSGAADWSGYAGCVTSEPHTVAPTASPAAPLGDTVTWRTPSPQLLALRRLEVAGLTVIAAIAGAVVAERREGGLIPLGVVVGCVVLGLLAERFVTRRFRAWAYAEREDDLLVRRGVLFARLSVVPYGRMQFIDVAAGPLERSFGLATLKMHTAAAASDARIPGLTVAEATRLRDRLAELGEAQAAGI
jgi:membrane protein YdbS with pleckstrin-like domain